MSAKKAQKYQQKKHELKKIYQENKAIILEKKANYYQNNKYKINMARKIRRKENREAFDSMPKGDAQSEEEDNSDSEHSDEMECPDDY